MMWFTIFFMVGMYGVIGMGLDLCLMREEAPVRLRAAMVVFWPILAPVLGIFSLVCSAIWMVTGE